MCTLTTKNYKSHEIVDLYVYTDPVSESIDTRTIAFIVFCVMYYVLYISYSGESSI